MKQLVQIGLNYAKSLKSSPEDENKEAVYVEVNLILHEPEYILRNGGVGKSRKLSEVEFCVSKKDAKIFAKAFNGVYKKIIELEKVENENKNT